MTDMKDEITTYAMLFAVRRLCKKYKLDENTVYPFFTKEFKLGIDKFSKIAKMAKEI